MRVVEAFLLAGVPLLAGCPWACRGGSAERTFNLESSEDELTAEDIDADGNLSPEACVRLCEGRGAYDVTRCEATPTEDTGAPSFAIECDGTFDFYCEGRRPPGFFVCSPRDLWRRRAEAEMVSVYAFVRIHRELIAHGAPVQLADRCLAAARDEVRHARVTAAIAGVPVRRPRVRVLPLRSLAAIARDNAVEGCVHETWAAARAHLEPHPAYRAIASDEVGHAQLAWDIEDWLGDRARPDLRRRAAARLVARVSPGQAPLARRLSTLLWA